MNSQDRLSEEDALRIENIHLQAEVLRAQLATLDLRMQMAVADVRARHCLTDEDQIDVTRRVLHRKAVPPVELVAEPTAAHRG